MLIAYSASCQTNMKTFSCRKDQRIEFNNQFNQAQHSVLTLIILPKSYFIKLQHHKYQQTLQEANNKQNIPFTMNSVIRIFIKLFLFIISKNNALNSLFQFIVSKSKRFQFLIIILLKNTLARSLVAQFLHQSQSKKHQKSNKNHSYHCSKKINIKLDRIELQKFKMNYSQQNQHFLKVNNHNSEDSYLKSLPQSTKLIESTNQLNNQRECYNAHNKAQDSFQMIQQMQANYRNYDSTLKKLYEEQIKLHGKVQPVTTNFCESVQISIQSNFSDKVFQIVVTSEKQEKDLSYIVPRVSTFKRNQFLQNISGQYLDISRQNLKSDGSSISDRSNYKQRDFYYFRQVDGQNLDTILNSQSDHFGQQRHHEIQQIENQFEADQRKISVIQENDWLKAQIKLYKQKNQSIAQQLSQYQIKISEQLKKICKFQSLQKTINEKDQTIAFLQKKLQQLEHDIQAKNDRISKLERENICASQLSNGKHEIQSRLLQMQGQISSLRKIIEDRNQQIDEISEVNRNLQQHLRITQAKQQNLISQRNSLQDQVMNLKNEFDRIVSEKQSYQNVQQEYEEMASKYSQDQNTIKMLKNKVNNYQKIIEAQVDTQNSLSQQMRNQTHSNIYQDQFCKRWSDNRSNKNQNIQSQTANQQDNKKLLIKNKSEQFFKNKAIQKLYQAPLKKCLRKMQVEQGDEELYNQSQSAIKLLKHSFKKIIDLQEQFQEKRRQFFQLIETDQRTKQFYEKQIPVQNVSDFDKAIAELETLSREKDILNMKIELLTCQNLRLKKFIKSSCEQLQPDC